MMKQLLLAALAAVAVAVTVAAPVKADDQSFLNDLAGKNTSILSPPQLIGMGHSICDFLHGGKLTREDFIAMARGYDGAAIFDAAQSEMCPDTLRH
jgi:hypothetical protein